MATNDPSNTPPVPPVPSGSWAPGTSGGGRGGAGEKAGVLDSSCLPSQGSPSGAHEAHLERTLQADPFSEGVFYTQLPDPKSWTDPLNVLPPALVLSHPLPPDNRIHFLVLPELSKLYLPHLFGSLVRGESDENDGFSPNCLESDSPALLLPSPPSSPKHLFLLSCSIFGDRYLPRQARRDKSSVGKGFGVAVLSSAPSRVGLR